MPPFPTPEELPEEHIFRLIYRRYIHTLDEFGVDRHDFSAFARPVDWDAVSARLDTPEGTQELRHWVKTDLGNRLFLHQFCYSNFGTEPMDLYGTSWSAVPRNHAISIAKKAIDGYRDAVYEAEHSFGHYPLGIICMRALQVAHNSSIYIPWTNEAREVFDLIYRVCPESVALENLVTGDLPLHNLLLRREQHQPMVPFEDEESMSEEDSFFALDYVFQTLVGAYSDAASKPNKKGSYPLHYSRIYSHSKTLARLYPQALLQHDERGWTPLQEWILFEITRHSIQPDVLDSAFDTINMMINTEPHAIMTRTKTSQIIMNRSEISDQPVQWSGDALDLVCGLYSEVLDPAILLYMEIEYLNDHTYRHQGGYVQGFSDLINETAEHSDPAGSNSVYLEKLFALFLKILRIMYGRETFLPVCAFTSGSRCRPWHLSVFRELLLRYGARERDLDGNLPLHLFLESCMLRKKQAIESGYARDDAEYSIGVLHTVDLIVKAHLPSLFERNEDGRLPIHLAIQTCRGPAFDPMYDLFLKKYPNSIHERDPLTNLVPFLSAAVGRNANLSMIYNLLRFNPDVLQIVRGDNRMSE